MNAPTLAKDIMVTRLVTLSPTMDVYDAIGLLLSHKISGAPVVDVNQCFLGVFSEWCCMSVLVKAAYEQLPSTEIGPFVDTDTHTVSEDTDLLSIAQIFLNTGVRRLPVIRDSLLVGQISRRDLLSAAHGILQHRPAAEESGLLYLSSIFDRTDAPIAQ